MITKRDIDNVEAYNIDCTVSDIKDLRKNVKGEFHICMVSGRCVKSGQILHVVPRHIENRGGYQVFRRVPASIINDNDVQGLAT